MFSKNILWLAPIFAISLLLTACNKPTDYINGDKAKDFSGVTIAGDSIHLHDFKGKLVLLDFWGSWCGPCREANRDLVRLYADYHDKQFKNADSGLEILSIGIEKDREAWETAIKEDGLIWKTHISDLQRFGSPLAKLYDISQIPQQFLIGGDGTIIGVNLTYDQLNKLLKRQLK